MASLVELVGENNLPGIERYLQKVHKEMGKAHSWGTALIYTITLANWVDCWRIETIQQCCNFRARMFHECMTCVFDFVFRVSWLSKVIVISIIMYHSTRVKMNCIEHSMNRRRKGQKFLVASCKVLLFCCAGSSSEWDHHLRTWGRTMKLVWDLISVASPFETQGFNPTYADISGPLISQKRFTKFNII